MGGRPARNVHGHSRGARLETRRISEDFWVLSNAARITSFSDRGVDDNGNGLIDRIEITINVKVAEAGEYGFMLHLEAANGERLQARGTRKRFDPGPQEITVSFSAEDVDWRLAQDGPYRIKDVGLWRVNRADHRVENRTERIKDTGVLTQAYSLAKLDRGPLYVTGVEEAIGVDTKKSGKFDLLRVRLGVFTPGGPCEWLARLYGPGYVDLANIQGEADLPKGRSAITLEFSGSKIGRAAVNGPLVLRNIELSCSQERFSDYHVYRLGSFRSEQFENVPEDLRLLLAVAQVSIEVGKVAEVGVKLERIGGFDWPVEITVTGEPPGVWVGGNESRIHLSAQQKSVPGRYPLTVTAEGGKLRRTATLELIIRPVDREAQQRAAAAEAARREAAYAGFRPLRAKLAAARRRANVMLVLDRSGSMSTSGAWGPLKLAAGGFAAQFAEGRDALGAFYFGTSVHPALLLERRAGLEAAARLDRADMPCNGATNTSYAYGRAYRELVRLNDPEGLNAIVLFTDGLPSTLTALWPAADHPGQICQGPLLGGSGRLLLYQAEATVATAPDPPAGNCRIGWFPDSDSLGAALDGPRPLERIASGPDAGRILASEANLGNAAWNAADNAARRARSDAQLRVVTFVIGLNIPPNGDELMLRLANDPRGPSFEKDKPAGLYVSVKQPSELAAAFVKVGEEIARRLDQ